MNYFIRKSLYYYFMMNEIAEMDGEGLWSFVADKFGVGEEDKKTYAELLRSETLKQLTSCYDIFTYKNYLGKYCKDDAEFGKSAEESIILDCKYEALERITRLFDKSPLYGNMLGALSHKYEAHHTAAVLYALCLTFLNDGAEFTELARNILFKELKDGKNSAAGIVLLSMADTDAGEVMGYLEEMPDMRVLPNELNALIKRYGDGDKAFKPKRVIGF